ncbi:DUF6308 family protein [Knoellia koreensis]|uniref:Uncharacterized protein n=1 Tax=Knoellia koreensis TaxID=2730921 RepID=A0A849HDL7_9MICO|nr:DUF6308 family protein [Knoellia sp. DB2414S]NNM45392.1 hypothetical protein [Knoellia sp. DB2414S]
MPWTLPPRLATQDDTGAVTALRQYFGLTGQEPFTGASFERLGGGGDRPEVRDQLTPEDLVAVTMLSVDVDPRAALAILGPLRGDISALLGKLPTGLDLVDVEGSSITPEWPAWKLWSRLHDLPNVGFVTASKLLARKRPRLIPVYDTVVRERVGRPDDFWMSLHGALQENDHALHRRLLSIRDEAGVGADISALRVFDIVAWMP